MHQVMAGEHKWKSLGNHSQHKAAAGMGLQAKSSISVLDVCFSPYLSCWLGSSSVLYSCSYLEMQEHLKLPFDMLSEKQKQDKFQYHL